MIDQRWSWKVEYDYVRFSTNGATTTIWVRISLFEFDCMMARVKLRR